jgi:hypothetical protein
MLTTTKFADVCLDYSIYGASQSNWLANINIGDVVFLSQFNYKSQSLFGPLRVNRSLFYNKDIIYPQQKYFYRVQFEPIQEIKVIEETDLYLNGIQSNNVDLFVRIINLIQQNKHLHCITLTNDEGKAIFETLHHNGINYDKSMQKSKLISELQTINFQYLWAKNRLDTKRVFSSESDLETYVILSLKDLNSREHNNFSKLLNKYEENHLQLSEISNQFIFGNAYPCDILILNERNINVFELKKEELAQNAIPQIEKEISKHLYYSLYSNRIKSNGNLRRFNYYLIYSTGQKNKHFKELIYEKYFRLSSKLNNMRENTITFAEYYVNKNILFLEEV